MDYREFVADTTAPRCGAGIQQASLRDRDALSGASCT
jgi:hypothetical protein